MLEISAVTAESSSVRAKKTGPSPAYGTRSYLPHDTPGEAIRRVEQRVRQGGDRIPEAVIRQRFTRSAANFRQVYRGLVDFWQVLDRRGADLVLVEEGKNR